MAKSPSSERRPGLTVSITSPTSGQQVPSGTVTVTGHYAPAGPAGLSVVLMLNGNPPPIAPANLVIVPGAARWTFTATFINIPANKSWVAYATAVVPGDSADTSVDFTTGN
ncbi:MAG: hypothetical protein K2W96_07445 [Gemmataceae bacterium]|nr:hypothetical protein [Gemmataceae bacterium]